MCYLTRDRAKGERAVREHAEELAALGVVDEDIAARLTFCTKLEDLPASQLVVESVSEQQALKVGLIGDLAAAEPEALIGSNTSSLSITALSSRAVSPERVVGMHFWYPAPLMPLVELVPGEQTSSASMDRGERMLREHGKTPIRLGRDIPGFVWNRLVVAELREATSLVEQGVVSARGVDLVVEQGLARRWSLTGPFASAVLGGIATFETVGRNLLPLLSADTAIDGLGALLEGYVTDPDGLSAWRNEQLAMRGEVTEWA